MTISKKNQKLMLLKFLSMLFGRCNGGYVEIRPFDLNYNLDFKNRSWIPVEKKRTILNKIWKLRHGHLFYGVATRTYEGNKKNKGTKEYLHEIPALFADLDACDYRSWGEMKEIIFDFPFEASCVVFSGHGLHIYYFLDPPINLEGNINRVERILKIIQDKMLKADSTSDSSRVLRAPYTENIKNPSKPLLVKISKLKDITYLFKDFEDQFSEIVKEVSTHPQRTKTNHPIKTTEGKIDIDDLKVSEKIKTLIRKGNNPQFNYKSRSEADEAVIVGLLASNYSEKLIQKIFKQYPDGIGEKYHERGGSRDQYLQHSINSAREFLSLETNQRGVQNE